MVWELARRMRSYERGSNMLWPLRRAGVYGHHIFSGVELEQKPLWSVVQVDRGFDLGIL